MRCERKSRHFNVWHLFLAIIQRAFAFELLELKVSMMNIVTPIRTLYIQHIHNNRQPFRRFILISKDTIYDVASFIIASIYLVCLRNDLFELVFTRMCVCVYIYVWSNQKRTWTHWCCLVRNINKDSKKFPSPKEILMENIQYINSSCVIIVQIIIIAKAHVQLKCV